MDTPLNSFDIVVARHTCMDAKQIYTTLKNGGKLLIRGVDQLDCWNLKRKFQKGQAYHDPKPISLIDYENILEAGFQKVELVPIHVREYYPTNVDNWMAEERYQVAYYTLKENQNRLSISLTADILSGKYGFMCQYNRKTNADTIWSVLYDTRNKKICRVEGNLSRKKYREDTRLKFC